ncbi:DUF423 domain-containing protein [Rubellicoccus peritrichatus]|uniref:DUF423 domain-containing protein n=1 Tax=Rubellicoccus peritrichatus TaxID=3080537 RepID=A0AAQ3QWH7_9BACT|nr:DUF423 domain-containing protein [Puniceicoccus sp. CR14]WOO41897.1 DUF423 domain-containing protein [Puniceicoccus sp. CR14]
MNKKSSTILIISSLCGFFGVVLGAFGAHALHDRLVEANMLRVWETAVDYQLFHTLALGIVAVLAMLWPKKAIYTSIAFLWGFGILFFSGSLYWLALGGPKWLGPITPIGGLLLILGWLLLGVLGVIGLKSRPE